MVHADSNVGPPKDAAPWPLTARFGDDGLTVGGCSSAALASSFGTPLLVVDEDDFRARCRRFARRFDHAAWAIKAFPAQALVQTAVEEGLMVLVASGGELDTCIRAGIAGTSVVMHGSNKSEEEIRDAMARGVGLLVIDHVEEINRVAAAAQEAGIRQDVLLRIAPGVEVDTHAYIRTGAPDTKFGIPIARGEAIRALERATAFPSLRVRGLHLHAGSQLLDVEVHRRLVGAATLLLEHARDRLGFEAEIVDVGGGFGVAYTDEDPPDTLLIAQVVHHDLRAACAARGLSVPSLMVEPGRAVSAPSAVTLYHVGTIKEIPGVRTYVSVDGGMSDNIRPALYGARHRVALASRTSGDALRLVTVVGKHCESGDIVARDAPLPRDLRRGDILAAATTGAYTYPMSSNYNKLPRPSVVVVSDGVATEVVRRETYEDLAARDVLLEQRRPTVLGGCGSPPDEARLGADGVDVAGSWRPRRSSSAHHCV